MARYFYQLNRRRMYLDREVYDSVNKFNITWNEIEKEATRLKINGHPKPTFNTAAMFIIDKKSEKMFKIASKQSKGLSLFPSDRKGFVVDNITLLVSLMIMMAILLVFAAYIGTQNDTIQASTSLDSTFKQVFNTSTSGFAPAADKGLIVGLVILFSFLLYSAYTIGTNFSLFLVLLLVNMMALFMLPTAEDFLVTTFYNNSYATAVATMPATFYVINHYTIFLTGMSVLLIIALLVRPRDEQGYGY